MWRIWLHIYALHSRGHKASREPETGLSDGKERMQKEERAHICNLNNLMENNCGMEITKTN